MCARLEIAGFLMDMAKEANEVIDLTAGEF